MARFTKAVAFVVICAIHATLTFAHDEADDRPPQAGRDKIRIVSLNPSGPVKRGVETKFSVEVEADLGSAKEGLARIAFNLDSPTSYRIVDRRELHEGRQKITFAVAVTPMEWTGKNQFAVMVNMGPKTTEKIWAPTAYVHKAIPVQR